MGHHPRRHPSMRGDRDRLAALLDERRRLRSRVTRLEEEVRTTTPFGPVVGSSPGLREALRLATLVAPADTTVLVVGETGTGKELIARFIHEHSRRARQGFVALNCAALPPTLVETELFGHEKGAFTGAVARKIGLFEQADGGTLLLDEIGDLPPEAQAKLLRVLQERRVERLGGRSSIPVDVRVIAATNQGSGGTGTDEPMRADLYFRLSVFPIHLPPLRERPEDVVPLARHFVEMFARRFGRPAPALSPAAIEALTAYPWPGNVRELQNIIERAVILSRGPVLDEAVGAALSSGPAIPLSDGRRGSPAASEPIRTLAETERLAIVRALESCGWQVSGEKGAARRLGLKPTTLHTKMKKLGIVRPRAATRPDERGRTGSA